MFGQVVECTYMYHGDSCIKGTCEFLMFTINVFKELGGTLLSKCRFDIASVD